MKQYYYKILLLVCIIGCASPDKKTDTKPESNTGLVTPEGTELSVPEGFKVTTVIDKLGSNRHLVVHTNGDIYVKLDKLQEGKGIAVLRESGGKYEVVNRFGEFTGTGIAIQGEYLYASSDAEVFRYKFVNNEIPANAVGEKIVSGLVNENQHASKSLALDGEGNIFVTIGAPSNTCQVTDRTKGSPGQDPCPILEKAGGIWQFKADQLNQSYAEGLRYATGLRNVVGLDWNKQQQSLFAMQHGRDQLSNLYPDQYDDAANAELPAEEFFRLKKGSDAGWPYCYYDPMRKSKVVGPEYGGDGKKTDRCDDKEKPILAFPAHWAPNALLFYTGDLFPEKYKNGAFIAFHGSWNRSPQPQQGYHVVFVPFKDGLPSGNYEVFATGFAGKDTIQGTMQAKYRPCGLAQGPDGSLFISDSQEGKIWKLSH